MEKRRTIQHISTKKRGRPKFRFNFGVLIIIFLLAYGGCFALYMIWANMNGDIFEESGIETSVAESSVQTEAEPETEADFQASEPAPEPTMPSNSVNPVPQSQAVDASYFDNCVLATDATLLDMASNTGLKTVFGNAELNAAKCGEVQVNSSFGNLTLYETIQQKKPQNLYIMLGSDIGQSDTKVMIENYTKLVNNLHAYLPDMKIYVMQLPPVRTDSETVTNAKINDYNKQLLQMATTSDVYCIDTNTLLKSSEGTLDEKYWDADKSKLNSEAYNKISDFILTHTVG